MKPVFGFTWQIEWTFWWTYKGFHCESETGLSQSNTLLITVNYVSHTTFNDQCRRNASVSDRFPSYRILEESSGCFVNVRNSQQPYTLNFGHILRCLNVQINKTIIYSHLSFNFYFLCRTYLWRPFTEVHFSMPSGLFEYLGVTN